MVHPPRAQTWLIFVFNVGKCVKLFVTCVGCDDDNNYIPELIILFQAILADFVFFAFNLYM